MGKPASDVTLLRRLRSDHAQLQRWQHSLQRESNEHAARADKAERECAEWEARFDLLLKRTPPPPAGKSEPGDAL